MLPAKPFPNHPRRRGVHYLTAQVSTSSHAELKAIAKYDGLTVSWITRKLIEEYIARWKTRHPELPLS